MYFSDEEFGIDYDVDSEESDGHPFEVLEEDDEDDDEDDDDEESDAEVTYTNKAGDFSWTTTKPAGPTSLTDSTAPEKGRFNIDLERIVTPLDAFLEFFDSQIIDKILKHTNAEAAAVGNPGFKPISRDEFLSFLGILINAGRMHANKVNLDDLWSEDTVNGMVFYRAVMGKSRFKDIMRYVRFDDSVTRRAPKKFKSATGTGIPRQPNTPTDRLALIRWLVEALRANFSSKYTPGHEMTIDERMVNYRGRCYFIVYIKAKPHPYGIKLWCITDGENTFLCFFDVYTGNFVQNLIII